MIRRGILAGLAAASSAARPSPRPGRPGRCGSWCPSRRVAPWTSSAG
ncbi:hypothetical protein ACFQY5_17585 [Paeniroseomonas aquatica]